MALITCPECGGQVSDKASVCIHCGFPLETTQEESNNLYDMIMNDAGGMFHQSYIAAVLENFGIPRTKSDNLLDQKGSVIFKGIKENNVQLIKKHFERLDCKISFVPSKCTKPNPLNDTWREYTLKIEDRENHKPHCPVCGSTNIKTISFTRKAVGVATLGIFSKSARSQFQCKDCSYKF